VSAASGIGDTAVFYASRIGKNRRHGEIRRHARRRFLKAKRAKARSRAPAAHPSVKRQSDQKARKGSRIRWLRNQRPECNQRGKGTGEIEPSRSTGVLGNITATLPGIRLFAPGEGGKSPKTGSLATFECGGGVVKVIVTGSLIGSAFRCAGQNVRRRQSGVGQLTFKETAGKTAYEKFLAGECGGNRNDCGPEQLTSNINGTEELRGQSVIATLNRSVRGKRNQKRTAVDAAGHGRPSERAWASGPTLRLNADRATGASRRP